MTKWKNRAEFVANISLIISCAVFLVFLMTSYLSPRNGLQPTISSSLGRTLSAEEIDWSQSERTLVIFFQKGCRFCEESISFYHRITREFLSESSLRIVVGFPNNLDDNTLYLREKTIDVKQVKELPFNKFGVQGTPTLLLVNRNGVVVNQWVGKLPPLVEDEILRVLRDSTPVDS
jgi:thioredoxin-related protein